MNLKSKASAVVATAGLALVVAACGGGGGAKSGSSGGGDAAAPSSKFNAGVEQVVNPSEKAGGTLHMGMPGDFDSVDPGDMYYGYAWNFARLYSRALTMFKPVPGQEGLQLVPDLAEELGKPSDGGKTWTYKLRAGVKFEDGTPITSKDVKYAVARSLDKDILPSGPTYFNDWIDAGDYKGPYKDKGKIDGWKGIETPDDQTIVFHLKKAYGGFDYFAMLPQTAPVPAAKDTGSKYKEHPVASGPYMFKSHELGKRIELVKNPNWDPASDPNRKQLNDSIEVLLGQNEDDLDQRLLSGKIDVKVNSTGVGANARKSVLTDDKRKQYSDSAPIARTWFTNINGDVPPFDNVHCRKAVMYAADRSAIQGVYGGPDAGGDVALSLMPKTMTGYKKIDPYGVEAHPTGDVDKAKQELTACGQPNGFSTSISFRNERAAEKQTAEALQQSLGRIGIKLELKGYPQGDYFKLYAGKPEFATKNNLGLMVYGWGADYPEGFGFFQQIVDSRVIRPAGNTNLTVKDPEIDKLIDQAAGETDAAKRNDVWAQVDAKVMDDAFILPYVWAHGLFYRPATLKNVFVSQNWGTYEYLTLSTQ
ncbi:peptide ABC transporter substrate-binding protein [Sphaerisporangium krabiense]|uniref:Peptide/nickel transport system substrate-binding protein n=1 Tax=Sphaerisporangium krabiense TaxID=763782 RepID=A0A7W8ZC13_9ACTN|nr:ABC transporter substrate-binding protein [Sphaerisporangium krabiense]MBB5631130.1 peptide/nickel transport system substrate-binding protein [Sphaerisporangium krabiense]GII61259.1 peptide ABC transporter substrate-binding protein [Sphaerisporangium krabiense]